MSEGIETVDIIEPWLYGLLTGDTALAALVGDRIIGTLSDGAVDPPYVVFFLASPRDITAVGGIRVQVEALYTVKAVARASSWNAVRPIAARLDTLIRGDGKTVTTTKGHLTRVRDVIVQYPETTDGVQYRHLGASWRIRANSLTG